MAWRGMSMIGETCTSQASWGTRARYPNMRLTPDQTRAIVTATRAVAGAQAQVKLFGSRLDDSARGGDIDLLVELPQPVERPAWLAARVTASVQRALGDRKVDVLVIDAQTILEPVHRAAKRDGVVLT